MALACGGREALSMNQHRWPRAAQAWFALFVLALAVGAFLRWYQLGTQILLDDEWHAIHTLLRADARDIATHLGLADYSIPLTLYYRCLYLYGGLSEWGMHLPMLICGVALLVVAPWLLRRQASPATLAIWSALLAISPLLVYHSRTARPYAITSLLTFVAIVAFHEWWNRSEKRGRWAITYVACTFLAGWLHLITLPFTLLPFIFFSIAVLRNFFGPVGAGGWRDLARLLLLGVLTAAPLAVALLPPMLNDWGALAAKAGTDTVSVESAYRSLLMCFGIARPIVFATLVLLLALGVRSWWRRDAMFVTYLGTIVIGAAIAVALSHPAWVQHPGTYARYLQPAIPFLLLGVAEGIATAISRLATLAQFAAALVVPAALFAAGPIPGYLYNPNQFMGHPYFQFDYDSVHNLYRTQLPDGPISVFYRRLAALPPRSLTLIEAPWSLRTDHDPEPLYQKLHRQYVKIGLVAPECGESGYGDYPESSGMRLAQFVHLSALLRGDTQGADFLVMHLHAWPQNQPPPPQWPDVTACLSRVEQHFGAPVYGDDEIEVFALSAAARNMMTAQR